MLLGDLDLSLICVDAPQGFDSSLPPFAAATNALAFVRFHGRNTETWERRTRTSSERFDYWYGEEELDEWVPRIAALAAEAEAVHLIVQHQHYLDCTSVLFRWSLDSLSIGEIHDPGKTPDRIIRSVTEIAPRASECCYRNDRGAGESMRRPRKDPHSY